MFDAFLFCDELDLLECRLIELDQAVYRHVLVESPITFQGRPKPLYFAENKERFAPWADKIIHVVADLEDYLDHWAREHASREALWCGLDDFGGDDILLLSDADEIPRAKACQEAVGRSLLMRNHVLAVNLLSPGWWGGTVAVSGPSRPSMQEVRDRKHSTIQAVIPDAGWHFPWLGGPDAIRAKVGSFSHPEMAETVNANAERLYANRQNPGSGGKHLILTAIDSSWPQYMQEKRGPSVWYWSGRTG